MRDKSTFRFLAAPLLAEGHGLALVNYPLCPDLDLAGLTEATRGFAAMFSEFLITRGAAPKWIAMGHSAGAHLAVELALTSSDVAAVVGLSGVYDLTPLIATPLNDRLRLDAASARQVKDMLAARVAEGAALVLTTHILEVAERVADRIGILKRGRLVAEGAFAELSAGRAGATLEDVFLELTQAA